MQLVIDAVEAHVPEDGKLFCTGYNPLVNFWTLRRNPTRYNTWEYPYLRREEETAEVIEQLAHRRDMYVLLFLPDRDSPLGEWLLANYRVLWRAPFAELLGPSNR